MDLHIINNTKDHQFETTIDGQTALIAYRLLPDNVISYDHTEVPEALEGKGIAAQLAKYVLNYARENHLRVLPLCPYVKAYIERHPEYKDLL